MYGLQVTTGYGSDLLVKEHDVGFPDFTGDDADDGDVAEFARFPPQLIVVP